jgi:hypothetical protein
MTIQEQVAALMSQLNYEWFKEKETEFKKEPFYHSETNRITGTIEESNYCEVGDKWVEEKREISFDLDLSKYCWNNNYHYGISSISEETNAFLSLDACSVASDIVSVLKKYTENFTDSKATHRAILKALDIVASKIQEMKKAHTDVDYNDVLDQFRLSLGGLLGRENRHILEQIDLLSTEDTLKFRLQQEELVALLLILQRSGFLQHDEGDNSFLHFCANYFSYYNSRDKDFKKPTNVGTLQKKYSEFRCSENFDMLKKIKSKLLPVLESIA